MDKTKLLEEIKNTVWEFFERSKDHEMGKHMPKISSILVTQEADFTPIQVSWTFEILKETPWEEKPEKERYRQGISFSPSIALGFRGFFEEEDLYVVRMELLDQLTRTVTMAFNQSRNTIQNNLRRKRSL